MGKRCDALILITLVALGCFSYFLIQIFTPPSLQYRAFAISGNIKPSEEIIGNQPQYVYVYYPYYNPNYLCRSNTIKLAKIKWKDNLSGEYTVYFEVPIGLKEVILTTDCTSCDYKVVNLKDESILVDLTWGSQKYEDSFQLSEQREEILYHARNFLNDMETYILDKPFNSSEIQSIKIDIKNGREAISDSDRIKDNNNESLLQAYYAEWFAWRAQYKIRLFELKYCVNESNSILKSYEHDKCYMPDNNAYKEYSSANSTYYSLRDSSILTDYIYDIKDIERIKIEIRYVHGEVDRVIDAKNDCENSLRINNETFEFQKPYCEARQVALTVSYLIWAIVCVYFGILIEKGRKLWKK